MCVCICLIDFFFFYVLKNKGLASKEIDLITWFLIIKSVKICELIVMLRFMG